MEQFVTVFLNTLKIVTKIIVVSFECLVYYVILCNIFLKITTEENVWT